MLLGMLQCGGHWPTLDMRTFKAQSHSTCTGTWSSKHRLGTTDHMETVRHYVQASYQSNYSCNHGSHFTHLTYSERVAWTKTTIIPQPDSLGHTAKHLHRVVEQILRQLKTLCHTEQCDGHQGIGSVSALLHNICKTRCQSPNLLSQGDNDTDEEDHKETATQGSGNDLWALKCKIHTEKIASSFKTFKMWTDIILCV